MADEKRQAAVVAALAAPALHGEPVEHRETHISHLFLTRDRAYKLKKALVLPFLDYGTVERRRFFCNEEIRLNRPLAPSVYRSVRAVVPRPSGLRLAPDTAPDAVDYVVEMRRFDERRTLAALLDAGAGGADDMQRLGRLLSRFHAEAPAGEGDGADRLRRLVGGELEQLAQAIGPAIPPKLRIVDGMARGFVEREAAQLDARSRRGLVREGHGDLRLEHVLVESGIELIDCVEFDRELRSADVAYDVAFLVMELHAVGAADLAAELVTAYRTAGGDPGTTALLHGFAACRALVRAKVGAVRGTEHSESARGAELPRFVSLARRLFWLSRCPLTVIVCGPAATGKTTLAAALSRASGLAHLSSDPVRKRLAGGEPTASLPRSGYSREMSDATYSELARVATSEAARGAGAVVDATFRHSADRAAFDDAFDGSRRVVLRLDVPSLVARRRALRRSTDATSTSDAGADIAAAQAAEFEPLAGAWRADSVTIEADTAPDEVTGRAEGAVDELLASRDP